MPFTLLPAVDVTAGRAVRLVAGDLRSETIYGTAPEAALAWQAGGAEWIHLVDLDAAFGRGSNAGVLALVVEELDILVELSGGIRDDASLAWALSTGCARVVLAADALADPAWCAEAIAAHGERIAVALDARPFEDSYGSVRHRLVARGSTRDVGDLWEVLAHLDREGCARYVVTDVDRDASLDGPNVELCCAVASATRAAVIASGGISTIPDLVVLAQTAATCTNLEGSIVGRALYADRFTLAAALEALRRMP